MDPWGVVAAHALVAFEDFLNNSNCSFHLLGRSFASQPQLHIPPQIGPPGDVFQGRVGDSFVWNRNQVTGESPYPGAAKSDPFDKPVVFIDNDSFSDTERFVQKDREAAQEI